MDTDIPSHIGLYKMSCTICSASASIQTPFEQPQMDAYGCSNHHAVKSTICSIASNLGVCTSFLDDPAIS